MQLKPCPFCGLISDTEWEDTIHPSYGWNDWKLPDGSTLRSYVSVFDPHKEGTGYEINCATTYGGCGVSISGGSEEEVITKWNTRKE